MELQTQCTQPANEDEKPKKPYRSELNLVLSYPSHSQSSDVTPSPELTNVSIHMPVPMELLNPSTQTNPLLLSNLPSPFPSTSTIPSSPLTPPTNFKLNDAGPFDKEPLPPDYSVLQFAPINAAVPNFPSESSIFCTVSAPSTPASDRKCIDKFCMNEAGKEPVVADKKKLIKRVSIAKDGDQVEPDAQNADSKDNEADKSKSVDNNSNRHHHSHMHHNSHSHNSLNKRRMSLDNTIQNSAKHKNHRQICHDPNAKMHRRESNRSNTSFKKRSRSDSTFGGHDYDPGGTSVSERYSNSLASSRESSTSLSVGKRRLSIISSGGSKRIPWCICF